MASRDRLTGAQLAFTILVLSAYGSGGLCLLAVLTIPYRPGYAISVKNLLPNDLLIFEEGRYRDGQKIWCDSPIPVPKGPLRRTSIYYRKRGRLSVYCLRFRDPGSDTEVTLAFTSEQLQELEEQQAAFLAKREKERLRVVVVGAEPRTADRWGRRKRIKQ